MQYADFDVIIIGGGIVGNTLACALLQGGMRVAVVEATPSVLIDTQQRDLRTFALTRASEHIFHNLEVWKRATALRISHFREMHVWDANGFGEIHFDSAEIAEPTLGYIVEQSVLQVALASRLAEFNLVRYRPAKIRNFNVTADASAVEVYLEDGHRLTARLLVGAEGAYSATRTLAGIPYNMHDYGQQAIVANVTTELPHQETAWQRFLATGPLAFLPLSDSHLCSIVWSVDTPVAQRLMSAEPDTFREMLSEAFAFKLGNVVDCSQRGLFPLQRRHVHHYVQARLALVGDAAHTIHPLAGQGVNLGLLDVAALCEVVLQAHHHGQDFGSLGILRRYERWRRGNNATVALLMDGFKYLFGSSFPLWMVARNIGLNLTNSVTPLKWIIMRQAMGLSGDLPLLARKIGY